MTSCLRRKGEVDKVRRIAPQFSLSEDQKLYRCFFSKPYLLCIHPEAVDPFSKELYEGICGNHIEGRSLSHRTFNQEYWWPNMQNEAQEYMKKCDQC